MQFRSCWITHTIWQYDFNLHVCSDADFSFLYGSEFLQTGIGQDITIHLTFFIFISLRDDTTGACIMYHSSKIDVIMWNLCLHVSSNI